MVTPGDVHDSLEFDDLLEDSNVFVDLQDVKFFLKKIKGKISDEIIRLSNGSILRSDW
jgi:hypothetical protein